MNRFLLLSVNHEFLLCFFFFLLYDLEINWFNFLILLCKDEQIHIRKKRVRNSAASV